MRIEALAKIVAVGEVILQVDMHLASDAKFVLQVRLYIVSSRINFS